jgi:hypothetical protein
MVFAVANQHGRPEEESGYDRLLLVLGTLFLPYYYLDLLRILFLCLFRTYVPIEIVVFID